VCRKKQKDRKSAKQQSRQTFNSSTHNG
jgi:hypothetical protein